MFTNFLPRSLPRCRCLQGTSRSNRCGGFCNNTTDIQMDRHFEYNIYRQKTLKKISKKTFIIIFKKQCITKCITQKKYHNCFPEHILNYAK